jgi:hypothetical protein
LTWDEFVLIVAVEEQPALIISLKRSRGAFIAQPPQERGNGGCGQMVIRMVRGLTQAWIPLVLVVAVSLSGLGAYRMHGIFGSENANASRGGGGADRIVPFNPKHVLYNVFGPAGTVGSISYLDENAQPHRADFTTLPWSYMVSTTLPSMFANVVAQGNSGTIGCRITVNGEVRENQSSTAQDAQVFCLVKAA